MPAGAWGAAAVVHCAAEVNHTEWLRRQIWASRKPGDLYAYTSEYGWWGRERVARAARAAPRATLVFHLGFILGYI